MFPPSCILIETNIRKISHLGGKGPQPTTIIVRLKQGLSAPSVLSEHYLLFPTFPYMSDLFMIFSLKREKRKWEPTVESPRLKPPNSLKSSEWNRVQHTCMPPACRGLETTSSHAKFYVYLYISDYPNRLFLSPSRLKTLSLSPSRHNSKHWGLFKYKAKGNESFWITGNPRKKKETMEGL